MLAEAGWEAKKDDSWPRTSNTRFLPPGPKMRRVHPRSNSRRAACISNKNPIFQRGYILPSEDRGKRAARISRACRHEAVCNLWLDNFPNFAAAFHLQMAALPRRCRDIDESNLHKRTIFERWCHDRDARLPEGRTQVGGAEGTPGCCDGPTVQFLHCHRLQGLAGGPDGDEARS